MLAINRASEICVGIVCAGIVLAGTDFGGARRRLAALLAALAADIARQFTGMLAGPGSGLQETQAVRRELIRRVIALDPVIDETIGKSSTLRYHSPVLQSTVDGLFAALTGWRTVAASLARLPDDQARDEAEAVLRSTPIEIRVAVEQEGPARWMEDPVRRRQTCEAAARSLIALPAGTPSLRLLARPDGEAPGRHVADARRLGTARRRPCPPSTSPSQHPAPRARLAACSRQRRARLRRDRRRRAVLDRTAWPNGAMAIVFAAIPVILFAPRAEQAYAIAMGFIGRRRPRRRPRGDHPFRAAAQAGDLHRLQPRHGLCTWCPPALCWPTAWRPAVFAAMAANFVPLLAPANQMSYDTGQFYNTALAIIVGCGAAALSFRLLPPLSPAFRTRRLLALTLRDLRRLATRSDPADARGLGGPHVHGRLSAMPDDGRATAARAAPGGAVGRHRDHPASPHRAPARSRARSSTRRSRPWRRATARSQPPGLPGSTTALPPIADLAPGDALASGRAADPCSCRRRSPSTPAYFDAGAPA